LNELGKEINLFNVILRNADIPTEHWLSLASIQWEVARGEAVLDQLLDTVRDQNFNESYSMVELQGVLEQYSVVRNAVLRSVAQGEQAEQSSQQIESLFLLDSISFAANQSVLEHQRILRTVSVNVDDGIQTQAEDLSGLKSVTARATTILDTARALAKLIRSFGTLPSLLEQLGELAKVAQSVVIHSQKVERERERERFGLPEVKLEFASAHCVAT
jgi:hypothetical protein